MDFTYEEQTKATPLETYEWDNIWWDHPEEEAHRVLLIGDSISCGYRRMVNELLDGACYADGFGTSKALDHPCFLEGVRYMAAQMKRCDLIHFNNGLHGWHLTAQAYERAYRAVMEQLQDLFPGTPIVIALTTPVRDPEHPACLGERNRIVQERNEIACRVAKDFGFEVNDLYGLMAERGELGHPGDSVHYTEAGYRVLAEQVANAVRRSQKLCSAVPESCER